MAAANDNRNARKRRANANAARSLATMTRLIHDIYGAEDTKSPNAEQVRDINPQSMANS